MTNDSNDSTAATSTVVTSTERQKLLLAQINDAYVESGTYERISNDMRSQLEMSGWYADMRDLVVEKLLRSDENQSVDEIVPQLINRGLESVPESLKKNVISQIHDFLTGNTSPSDFANLETY